MSQYKVYRHAAGRIERLDDFAASDDASAIRKAVAHALAVAGGVELWRGGRLVKFFPSHALA